MLFIIMLNTITDVLHVINPLQALDLLLIQCNYSTRDGSSVSWHLLARLSIRNHQHPFQL